MNTSNHWMLLISCAECMRCWKYHGSSFLLVNSADAFHKFRSKLCKIVFHIYRLNFDAGVKCYSLCQTSFSVRATLCRLFQLTLARMKNSSRHSDWRANSHIIAGNLFCRRKARKPVKKPKIIIFIAAYRVSDEVTAAVSVQICTIL